MKRVAWALFCLALLLPLTASAWSPLRSENSNVKKGNALMAKEQYAPALEAYDEAARELPEARGVQLNRGLALLGQDNTEQAKEAFLAAADPTAPPDTRADAYYDLGIAYAREGDVLSEQEEYERATAHFREAADAFKRALRVRPGDRNAAWNLEYALQRIREQEEKQQEQQQDQDQERDQQQDQQDQQQDQQDQQQDQEERDQQQQQGEQDQEEPDQQQQQGEQDQEQQGSQSQNEGQRDAEEQQPSDEQPLPPEHVQRFLDALEQNEESLPLQRARRRSAGRRPPEKDW